MSALLAALVLVSQCAYATELGLYWSANHESDLAGYRIYYGRSSGHYDSSVDVGLSQSHLLTTLTSGQRYYFAVTAYDASGNESDASREISAIAGSSSSDSDGDDSDGDGLSDAEEARIGTDPHLVDTDRDGRSDGEEVVDQTDPLDRGSVRDVPPARSCAEWNGFLPNLWNILELVNSGDSSRKVLVSMYARDGSVVNSQLYNVLPGRQVDVLLHDNPARLANSYGLVCIRHSGEDGQIDGRVVYYRVGDAGNFEFGFALPLSGGKRGSQFVPWNTYQPSYRASDQGNLVANWIQLTNLDSSVGRGVLVFHGMNGEELGSFPVTLGPGERYDISGHQFGPSQVGLVAWFPADTQHHFLLRNVRYLYDNPVGTPTFASAFQLDGNFGSSSILAVPVSTAGKTAVVEVSNAKSEPANVGFKVYDPASQELLSLNFVLPGYASRHIILDDILHGQDGLAVVHGDSTDSIVAVGMHYARFDDGSVASLYGLAAQEAFHTPLTGSYNTYLQQTSTLVLSNPSSLTVEATVTLTSAQQTSRSRSVAIAIPPHTLRSIRINDYQSADEYGVVTVDSVGQAGLVSWVLRERGQEFTIPTALR